MSHPSARTLELLSLLAAGVPRTGADLAARLGVSPRTLRRDIGRLRELGYRVESSPGGAGSYRLPPGQGVPPLVLSAEEAVATAVGLRHAAGYGAGPAADTALRKLEAALPARLRGRIEALLAATEARPGPGEPGAGDPGDPDTVGRLATAAHLRSRVRFRHTARDGTTTERRAEPHRLLLLDHRWYLLAWDEARADWRTFRVDRISALRVPGTTFGPRPLPPGAFAPAGQAAPAIPAGSSEPPAGGGSVLFLAPAAAVAGRLTARAGVLEPAGPDRCRYRTGPDDWEWLATALAAVGVPYRVEGPPELARATRALVARAAAAAPDTDM
ncbi:MULTISPECIES: helix-turn-helix transcriptional regulator [Streptomyces]|uniref:Predicted DNA-binding transcriptional regulator YafY, contains an HTH and WYL domains n=2 Tax=Streptomyces TaxID=1883 RepID=A0A1I6UR29_9ACTN|nr:MULTISPECIES: transcriptional regulator [Streptomyces]QKV69164.1 transcriptional regulator [Streptomyces harbinensis]SFT03932.1 Predicted DNA-binding transcriptional regulator YafY, contains an HTH and WYL domains [Streptomyces harbinensis]